MLIEPKGQVLNRWPYVHLYEKETQMIVVRVELHSARTLKVTEIAKMVISNDGTGTDSRGNYNVRVYKKGKKESVTMRTGKVAHYPRKSSHTWNLVARALESVGYR